jgi:hypothetical protein
MEPTIVCALVGLTVVIAKGLTGTFSKPMQADAPGA